MDKDFQILDIDDTTDELAVINFSDFEPQDFASYRLRSKHSYKWNETTNAGCKILVQSKDANKDIEELKHRIKTVNASVKEVNQYILLEDIIYYLPNLNDDPIVLLYVQNLLIKVTWQNQDENGHRGTEKSVGIMYVWGDR